MEISCLFIRMCHFINCRFIEMFSDDLKPSGSPFENPHGTEIAGTPARLIGTVNISFAYSVNGSLITSPIL